MQGDKESRIPAGDSRDDSHESESRGHDTRVDAMSEDRATHPEYPNKGRWERPSSLEAPEPRDGMTQRWIRVSIRGEEDPRNVNLRLREGWKPRAANTVPEDFMSLTRADDGDGRLIVDDLMLCEMPSDMYAERRAYYDSLTESQMTAVNADLEDVQIQGHRITKTHTSKVSMPPRVVGRQAQPADD